MAKGISFTCNQVFGDVDVTESEEPENENTLECDDEDFFDFDIEDSLFAGSQMIISILLIDFCIVYCPTAWAW